MGCILADANNSPIEIVPMLSFLHLFCRIEAKQNRILNIQALAQIPLISEKVLAGIEENRAVTEFKRMKK